MAQRLKKKVTYIISDINRALAFEWIATYLDKEKFELNFVLLNPGDSVLEDYLQKHNIPVKRIRCAGKKDWVVAWMQLYKYLKQQKPAIIHCHLLNASILGLSAAKLAGIKARIYTRHHSSLHHVYFPKGVFWDKLCNNFATKIVAISGIVKKILTDWEKVPEKKIILIPHGFLLDEFEHEDKNKINTLTEKYDIANAYPVIGVISRFTEWKGIQYIIPAFKNLLNQYPLATLLLFNASGDYSEQINKLLAGLPNHAYRTVKFEPEITTAYHLMDVCVHTPTDEHSEAFGQVYIEALAAGIPIVCTLSGIANDSLVHKQNAWIVPHKDSGAITNGIQHILQDETLRQSLISKGRETAKDFSLQRMINSLNNLYETA